MDKDTIGNIKDRITFMEQTLMETSFHLNKCQEESSPEKIINKAQSIINHAEDVKRLAEREL